jgi:uncharacterized membrane protein YkvA (DUF1232 family)
MKKIQSSKKTRWVWAIVAVIYILSPVDLIPDFLLPLGAVDDLAVLTALLYQVLKTINDSGRFLNNKVANEAAEEPDGYIEAEVVKE